MTTETSGRLVREDQLARGLRILGRHDARRGEQRQRLVEDAPFGQREVSVGTGGDGRAQERHSTGRARAAPARHCRAVRAFGGGGSSPLVRKGLMSMPPRRVKRA